MSKQQSMEALMDATVEMLAHTSQAALTIREIAAKAGVNHGLVHHYFGSKSALIREAALRASRILYEGQPAEVRVDWTYRFFGSHPEFLSVLARLVLDGSEELLRLVAPPADRFEGWLGHLERRFGALGIDARVVNAVGVGALMGYLFFRPLLAAALDLPEDADAQVERLVSLVDQWLQG